MPAGTAAHAGIDRTAGTSTAVSVWETAEQAQFSGDTTLSDLITRLRTAGMEFDPLEISEIAG